MELVKILLVSIAIVCFLGTLLLLLGLIVLVCIELFGNLFGRKKEEEEPPMYRIVRYKNGQYDATVEFGLQDRKEAIKICEKYVKLYAHDPKNPNAGVYMVENV